MPGFPNLLAREGASSHEIDQRQQIAFRKEQASGDYGSTAEFSILTPPLSPLESHRKRVRLYLDENEDGTRNWDRVHKLFKAKKSRAQRDWYEPCGIDSSERSTKNSLDRTTHTSAAEKDTVLKSKEGPPQSRQDIVVPRHRNGHDQSFDSSIDRKTTNVPKINGNQKLVKKPEELTVEQAEVVSYLESVGSRPKFVAMDRVDSKASSFSSAQPDPNLVAFEYNGSKYDNDGNKIQRSRTKRTDNSDPMKDMDGDVLPWGVDPSKQTDAAKPKLTGSKTESIRGSGRETKGAATTRGRGGTKTKSRILGGISITRGGGTRGGRQTTQSQQAPSGHPQGSTKGQYQTETLVPKSSVPTGQSSHNGYLQDREMQEASTGQGMQTMDRQVHVDAIPQGRPSGFMPAAMTAPAPCTIPEKHVRIPQGSYFVPPQRQGEVSISSAGPDPGSSYQYPSLEHDLSHQSGLGIRMPTPIQAERGPPLAFPIECQRPSVPSGLPSASRQQIPTMLYQTGGSWGNQDVNYGQRHISMMQMPAPRGQPMQRGPQQAYLNSPQGPASIPNPFEVPMPGPYIVPNRHGMQMGNQAGQTTQTAMAQPMQGCSQMLHTAQHSRPAIAGTEVIDFESAARGDKLS